MLTLLSCKNNSNVNLCRLDSTADVLLLLSILSKDRVAQKDEPVGVLPTCELTLIRWLLPQCKNNEKIMEEYGIFRADSNQMREVGGKQRIYLEWSSSLCQLIVSYTLESLY